jgi:hypothetical protein
MGIQRVYTCQYGCGRESSQTACGLEAEELIGQPAILSNTIPHGHLLHYWVGLRSYSLTWGIQTS